MINIERPKMLLEIESLLQNESSAPQDLNRAATLFQVAVHGADWLSAKEDRRAMKQLFAQLSPRHNEKRLASHFQTYSKIREVYKAKKNECISTETSDNIYTATIRDKQTIQKVYKICSAWLKEASISRTAIHSKALYNRSNTQQKATDSFRLMDNIMDTLSEETPQEIHIAYTSSSLQGILMSEDNTVESLATSPNNCRIFDIEQGVVSGIGRALITHLSARLADQDPFRDAPIQLYPTISAFRFYQHMGFQKNASGSLELQQKEREALLQNQQAKHHMLRDNAEIVCQQLSN